MAAYHEAGHAVAVLMRGGSTLEHVRLVVGQHGAGTRASMKEWDWAFYTWAGAWAEARFTWGDRAMHEDYDGVTFQDHLTEVLRHQPADRNAYRRAAAEHDAMLQSAGFNAQQLRQSTERTWCQELSDVWPAVEYVAEKLLEGSVLGHKEVEAAVAVAVARWRPGHAP